MTTHRVFLKPKKEQSLERFHPWIFSGAIARIEGDVKEGELVDVYTAAKKFIARGHYQIGSIAVRVLTFTEDEVINNEFWLNTIKRAFKTRKEIGVVNPPYNDTFRLIHGEGDYLPGLIVDIYSDTAVLQAHSVGMHLERRTIAEAIVEATDGLVKNVYYKSETTLPYKADIDPVDSFLIGGSTDNIATENGLKFHVDWLKGQKTGFFIDQRDNRALIEKYSKNKSVLNMFCYTGGFSFYAMRGEASLVHSVDSSSKAVDLTDKNIALNFPDDPRHDSFAEDAFKYLDRMGSKYDVIVLDPPAFAKHRRALRNALQGYRKINAKAFEKIKPGGILFTFSCSQVVSKDHFRTSIFSAAAIAGRKVRILHQLTQPADHPINIYHPEGEYLKGLVVYVE